MPATRDGETFYTITGEGPPLVLVHGFGARHGMWAPLIPALAARHRVIAYDLLGHGCSAPPGDPVTLSSFAEQVARLMDDIGVGRAALAGFSLGGMIVRRFAIDHPDRASALVVLNSPHDRTPAERQAVLSRVEQAAASGPASTIEAAIERWFTPAWRAAHPEAIAAIRADVLANDPAVYPRIYRVLALGDAEIATAIAALRLPFLAMTGAEDPGNTPDMSRRMAGLVPGGEVDIVPRLRHMGLWEDPDRFTGRMLEFLGRRHARG